MTTDQLSLPARLRATVELGRPLFLTGGFVLFGLGTLIGAGERIDVAAWAWGQAIVTASQLMTHYANDYHDLAHDRANLTPTPWSGGSRVLPDGRLSPNTARTMATFFGGLALLLTALMVAAVRPAPLAVGLILAGMLLAWQYSAPPLRLHSRGVGELTAALVVTFLTPLLGTVLQAGRIEPTALLVCLPLMCHQFAMLFTVEFPDAAADAATGKRTLVVRLGVERASRLYGLVLLAAYALLPPIALAGVPLPVPLFMALTAPLALWQGWRVGQGAASDPARQGNVAFWGVGILIGTAGLALAGFAWLRWFGP